MTAANKVLLIWDEAPTSHKHHLYQDSMAMVRAHGKPHYFITMTPNPVDNEVVVTMRSSSTSRSTTSKLYNLTLSDSSPFSIN